MEMSSVFHLPGLDTRPLASGHFSLTTDRKCDPNARALIEHFVCSSRVDRHFIHNIPKIGLHANRWSNEMWKTSFPFLCFFYFFGFVGLFQCFGSQIYMQRNTLSYSVVETGDNASLFVTIENYEIIDAQWCCYIFYETWPIQLLCTEFPELEFSLSDGVTVFACSDNSGWMCVCVYVFAVRSDRHVVVKLNAFYATHVTHRLLSSSSSPSSSCMQSKTAAEPPATAMIAVTFVVQMNIVSTLNYKWISWTTSKWNAFATSNRIDFRCVWARRRRQRWRLHRNVTATNSSR